MKPITASGIPVHCAHARLADVTTLVANPRNPNKHGDAQVALLAKIIRHQGWRAPITISKRSGFIVTGHGRLQAALLLQVEKVPVDEQDFKTEADEWAHLVADNRIAELSETDTGLLKDLLGKINLGEFDMDVTGFDNQELERVLNSFQHEGAGASVDPAQEWKGMPDYEGNNANGITMIVHFKDMADKMKFAALIKKPITEKTKFCWWPIGEDGMGKEYQCES